MAIHYSSGIGRISGKDTGDSVIEVKYLLIETDPTKHSRKKWWGDLSTGHEVKRVGDYVIEFEDRRKGECLISGKAQQQKGGVIHYYYRFNGRGKLSRR